VRRKDTVAVFKTCFMIYKMDIIKLQIYGIIYMRKLMTEFGGIICTYREISTRNTNNKKYEGKLRKTSV